MSERSDRRNPQLWWCPLAFPRYVGGAQCSGGALLGGCPGARPCLSRQRVLPGGYIGLVGVLLIGHARKPRPHRFWVPGTLFGVHALLWLMNSCTEGTNPPRVALLAVSILRERRRRVERCDVLPPHDSRESLSSMRARLSGPALSALACQRCPCPTSLRLRRHEIHVSVCTWAGRCRYRRRRSPLQPRVLDRRPVPLRDLERPEVLRFDEVPIALRDRLADTPALEAVRDLFLLRQCKRRCKSRPR